MDCKSPEGREVRVKKAQSARSSYHDEFTDNPAKTPVARLDAVEVDPARDALSLSRDQIPRKRSDAVRAVVAQGLNEIAGDGVYPDRAPAARQIAELELLAARVVTGFGTT
jgi:hypothetical protein